MLGSRSLVCWLTVGALLACEPQAELEPPPRPPPATAPEPEPEPEPELEAPEAACGDADACFDKGAQAERAGTLAEAAKAFEAACGLGSGAACGRLGQLYRDGRGVPADDRRARSLFEQGCALGSTRACDAVGH